MSTVSDSVKTAIASVAHQLWLERGCPIGSDQEDWFKAEVILKNALGVKSEDLIRRPSIPFCNTQIESEMPAEFTLGGWQGHWEVWEREWAGARWVWDVRDSDVVDSSRFRGSARPALD